MAFLVGVAAQARAARRRGVVARDLDFRHKPDILLPRQGALIAGKGFCDTGTVMTSPTTEEAKTIIDAAPSYGPLRPVEYAAALPPRAGALARVLRQMEIVDAARDYARADADAGDAQGQFNRLGWTAAYSGFSAAVLGGILLYMGSDPSTATIRSNLGLAQSLFLSVSLLCAVVLVFFKPYRRWRNRRGDAEVKRLQIFALMMKANEAAAEGEAPLLPLQLECFRRHLFHDQRDFFTRRGRQQSMTVLAWRVIGAFALLLVLASLFPQLMRLQALGLLPDALQKLVAGLPLDQKHYVLAGLIGGSLQGLLAALAVMSPAERNAGKYREMRGLFEKYTSEDLTAARAAAAAGDVDLVREFAVRITADLAAEGREWLILHGVLSETAPRWFAQQNRGTPG